MLKPKSYSYIELLQSTKTDAHAQLFDRKRVSGRTATSRLYARASIEAQGLLFGSSDQCLPCLLLYPLSSVGQGHSSDFFCPSVHVWPSERGQADTKLHCSGPVSFGYTWLISVAWPPKKSITMSRKSQRTYWYVIIYLWNYGTICWYIFAVLFLKVLKNSCRFSFSSM